jgi:Uma2 family endonuclease
LPPDNEPQPDALLLIEPACGGQSRQEGGYLAAAPELVVEVASSSVSYDLHGKFRLYEQAKVREYVVIVLREKQVRWFALDENSRFVERHADADGIFRSTEQLLLIGRLDDPSEDFQVQSCERRSLDLESIALTTRSIVARNAKPSPEV